MPYLGAHHGFVDDFQAKVHLHFPLYSLIFLLQYPPCYLLTNQ